MNTRFSMTFADRALIVFFLALSAGLFFAVPRWAITRGEEIEIRVGETVAGRYSLSENREVEVTGPLGSTVVFVEEGRAGVRTSPCPHKTCVKMGTIGPEGGVVVCIPNRVVVTVGKGAGHGLDAVSR